ncbi:hypothetical protein CCP3SC1AL1_520010 [Gammaproteobacteria bacterium]
MAKIEVTKLDWFIIGGGIALLFTSAKVVGGVILGFMGCLYLQQKLSNRR